MYGGWAEAMVTACALAHVWMSAGGDDAVMFVRAVALIVWRVGPGRLLLW
jgi:hypothetical protein